MKFEFIESRTYSDRTNSVFYNQNGMYFLEKFSQTGERLSLESIPSFDESNFLTPVTTEQRKRTIKRKILDFAPVATTLGGLATWGYFANQGNAKAGLLAFGTLVFCGIGLRAWSKELSDRAESFNNELFRLGYDPLDISK
jgi:hypothetical protein